MNQLYHYTKTGLLTMIAFMAFMTVGCTSNATTNSLSAETAASADPSLVNKTLTLPTVTAVDLHSGKLKVIATTSIIGDVVANVGGEAIDLTVLMKAGQDPHSYQPGAADLTAVTDAHVIFVNGWGLEENLTNDLATIGENVPIVPISANIVPHEFGADTGDTNHVDTDNHEGIDPHVWFAVPHVRQWVQNIDTILSTLDPAHAATYNANAARYTAALDDLDQYTRNRVASLPVERRILITNHDAFGYFAQEYGFTVLGTVIPGLSTLAEPSASDIVNLVAVMRAQGICTIFSETSTNSQLAQTVATELDSCVTVQMPALYTGALGASGSGADTYIDMFRVNVDTIVSSLAEQ